MLSPSERKGLLRGRAVLISIYGDGNPAWEFSEGRDFTSAAIDRYGRLYIGAGDLCWLCMGIPCSGHIPSKERPSWNSVLGPGGVIYCGSGDGRMFAVNPDGSTAGLPDGWSDLLFCGGGFRRPHLFWFRGDSRFYSLNPDGTLHWSYPIHGADGCSAPAIAQDGTVLVGWNDGKPVRFSHRERGIGAKRLARNCITTTGIRDSSPYGTAWNTRRRIPPS